MQISVLAIKYCDGAWQEYKHLCSQEETKAVIDSAGYKACERVRHRIPQIPQDTDFLAGASNLFNVARGADDKPVEGDTVVFGVQVDD